MTNLFQNFEFDTILHTMSGFILAYIGSKLILKLNGKNKINKIFATFFILCFSMFSAIMWEFFEFTNDFFYLADMQKDRIIYNFSSEEINRKRPNTINNIDHTILYDKDDKVIIEMDGYLDIGLIDTIKDLFVNFVGATAFSIIFYFKSQKYKAGDLCYKLSS